MTVAPLRIGDLVIDPPVIAAPMAGFTDFIFRGIVRDFGGCGLLFTEMIAATEWVASDTVPWRLHGVAGEPRPLGVQIWGREPDQIEETARRVAALGVSVIDLNFGCPKRRIMRKHAAGATLLRDPATVGRLVAAALRGAGSIPVTAKMRLGTSTLRPAAPDVARSAVANGARAVTVHGRAADQHYGFPCRLDAIAEVVRAVDVPVIANGDIHDGPSALRALAETGAAGVMVARGALTRPWVFREIAAALRGEPTPPAPTVDDQRRLLLAHHEAMVRQQGDRFGTILMRKFAVRYLHGLPGSRPFREAITRTENASEFRTVIERMMPGSLAPR